MGWIGLDHKESRQKQQLSSLSPSPLCCSLRPSIPLFPLRFSVAGSRNPTLQLVNDRPSCPFYVIRPPGGSRSVLMESEDVPVGDRKESVRVKKKTLQAVLEQCQRALERLSDDQDLDDCGDDDCATAGANLSRPSSLALRDETEADELCDLLKSRVICPDFLEKIENAHVATPPSNTVVTEPPMVSEEGSSWDLVSDSDIWDNEKLDVDKDDYVMVREEDIVDGIACFMAAYLASLKETKVLSPNQLQEALTKTFSLKKKKGKLRKAWDGSKVIYNVASWGATAIGIYQNPVILSAASQAFWTSCQVISKLL